MKNRKLVLSLLLTPLGRRRMAWGLLFRLSPLLWPLARVYRAIFLRNTRIVAVTGSFGKTTATRAVMAALDLPYERHTVWNAGGLLAIELMRIPPRARFGALEVGINTVGTMSRYARFIRPDITIVTSIGSEHNSTFGALEVTRREKARLVEALPSSGLAVLNGDDPNVLWMERRTTSRVISYGFDERNTIRARDVSVERNGRTRFRVSVSGEEYAADSPLLGRHMVYPVLSALAVAHECGVSAKVALERLSRLAPAPERLELLSTPHGALVILDSRKGGLETIHAGLDVLGSMPGRRKIVVLGDIEEPPSSQGPLYKEIGAALAGAVAFAIFVGGRKAHGSLESGARGAGIDRERVLYAGKDVRRATDLLRDRLAEGDVVWIKGRSTQHLGRIGLALSGRSVTCDIVFCPPTPACATCPMLERVPLAERLRGDAPKTDP
ncbi:Mur ligase family protein [Candidatus Bipolaricaulota bacterium]